jgi:hypothetical protein
MPPPRRREAPVFAPYTTSTKMRGSTHCALGFWTSNSIGGCRVRSGVTQARRSFVFRPAAFDFAGVRELAVVLFG